MLFGAHVSIAGGVFNAPVNAAKIGCECFQMFSKSPRGGKTPELTDDVVKQFKENLRKAKISDFYIHTPYYINLASTNNRIYYGSISAIREDLERGDLLGAKFVMTHLGSSKDLGREKALIQTVEGIDKILDNYTGETEFLIEMSAGSGEIIGDTFEEIGYILKNIKSKNAGVCFDTCHGFASGYDLRDNKAIEKTFSDFDKIIGLEKLKMFHFNDSKVELGSHKDRHEDIGRGLIGENAFEEIINHPKLKHLNAVIETPEEKLSFKQQLALLKKLRGKNIL